MALICMLPTNTMNATVSCVFSACYNFTEPITPIMEIVKRYFKGNRVVYNLTNCIVPVAIAELSISRSYKIY